MVFLSLKFKTLQHLYHPLTIMSLSSLYYISGFIIVFLMLLASNAFIGTLRKGLTNLLLLPIQVLLALIITVVHEFHAATLNPTINVAFRDTFVWCYQIGMSILSYIWHRGINVLKAVIEFPDYVMDLFTPPVSDVQHCSAYTADGTPCRRWRRRPSTSEVQDWYCSKLHKKQARIVDVSCLNYLLLAKLTSSEI